MAENELLATIEGLDGHALAVEKPPKHDKGAVYLTVHPLGRPGDHIRLTGSQVNELVIALGPFVG